MFSTLSKTEIIIYVTFILSSANAFNLDKVKFLSPGNGLNGPKEDGRYLMTLWEKDKILEKSIFSFSNNERIHHLSHTLSSSNVFS